MLFPHGQHRSVLRSATDIDSAPARDTPTAVLPRISVASILPVAQFVKQKLQAAGERANDRESPRVCRALMYLLNCAVIATE